MVERDDLILKFEREGFANMGGVGHDKYMHPDGRYAIIPRLDNLSDRLAEAIRRQAKLI